MAAASRSARNMSMMSQAGGRLNTGATGGFFARKDRSAAASAGRKGKASSRKMGQRVLHDAPVPHHPAHEGLQRAEIGVVGPRGDAALFRRIGPQTVQERLHLAGKNVSRVANPAAIQDAAHAVAGQLSVFLSPPAPQR